MRKLIGSTMLTLVLTVSFASASVVNVGELQKKLRSGKATWIAKENWVTKLSKNDLHRLLGNNEMPKSNLDYSDAYAKSRTYESIDWRNVNGINWLGAVLNQGNCGSCVAFATIGTIEAQTSISRGTPWLKPSLSPQALFACGGGACNRGWTPGAAASFVKSKGFVDNACAPYVSGATGEDVACKQFCNNQAARTQKVTDFNRPSTGWGGSVQAVKEALKKGPLVTTMTVYEDFMAYAGGIYKATSNKSVGGHAVSLVGFNDAERYWIVRNSWGTDWGEGGFVRISWDDKSGIVSSTIAFNTVDASNTVSIVSPSENNYVSGAMTVKVTALKADDFVIRLQNKAGQEIETMNCEKLRESNCTATFYTDKYEDGKYELVAVSKSDANVKTIVRGISILNKEVSMSVSFVASGFDINKPLVGRSEFDLTTKATPVDIQTLDFFITKLDGTIVAKRSTDVVVPRMKQGFRFNTLPNGEYVIFYRGNISVNGKNYSVDSEHVKITTQN